MNSIFNLKEIKVTLITKHILSMFGMEIRMIEENKKLNIKEHLIIYKSNEPIYILYTNWTSAESIITDILKVIVYLDTNEIQKIETIQGMVKYKEEIKKWQHGEH